MKKTSYYLWASLALSVVFFFVVDLQKIESQEGNEIGNNTFSLNNFLVIFPLFLKAYGTFKLYGCFSLVLLLSLYWLRAVRPIFPLAIIGMSALFYLLLYSAHYRSYYQVHNNDVGVFETLRYSTNFFPLLCLFLSIIPIENFPVAKLKLTLIAIYLGIAAYLSFDLRSTLSEIENNERIKPTIKALALIEAKDLILTDVPMLFHIIGPVNQKVADLHASHSAQTVAEGLKHGRVFIMSRAEGSDEKRYIGLGDLLNSCTLKPVARLNSSYMLSEVVHSSAQ